LGQNNGLLQMDLLSAQERHKEGEQQMNASLRESEERVSALKQEIALKEDHIQALKNDVRKKSDEVCDFAEHLIIKLKQKHYCTLGFC